MLWAIIVDSRKRPCSESGIGWKIEILFNEWYSLRYWLYEKCALTSKYSTPFVLSSSTSLKDGRPDCCCVPVWPEEFVSLGAIVQTVDNWHFLMHFLWQLMLHLVHWAASFSQIFLPQKSQWAAREKWVRTKLCWYVVPTSTFLLKRGNKVWKFWQNICFIFVKNIKTYYVL